MSASAEHAKTPRRRKTALSATDSSSVHVAASGEGKEGVQRRRRAKIAPPTWTELQTEPPKSSPTVPLPETDASASGQPPTREELRMRLRASIKAKRAPGRAARTTAPTRRAREASERLADAATNPDGPALSAAQLRKMEQLQQKLEECGNDTELLCNRLGIDAAFIPAIKSATEKVQRGEVSVRDGIVAASEGVIAAASAAKQVAENKK